MQKTPCLPEEFDKKRGFALISTLSVVVLLAFIAVGILSLSAISIRRGANSKATEQAKVNAKLGLMEALNELQKTMGPDQRISASADIFSGGAIAARQPVNGKFRWVGVWDTSNFDPADPDASKDAGFQKWLVSSAGGATALTDAALAVPANSRMIFTGATPAENVTVDMVTVNSPSGQPGSYAYWVEDEGVKATLGWREGVYANNTEKQNARLSSIFGIDPNLFLSTNPTTNNPLNAPAYPLSKTKETTNIDGTVTEEDTELVKINRATSLEEIALATEVAGGAGAPVEFSAWETEFRHHVTMGSKAVLCDVKNGGLRRDLSLAFEMDGEADFEAPSFDGDLVNSPTLFNDTKGEFVGFDSTDRLSNGDLGEDADNQTARGVAIGMENIRARYLYRVAKDDGSLFSNDLVRNDSVVRGPTWWALRDYANLYKRLELGSSGEYRFEARAYYPNVSAQDNFERYNFGAAFGANSGSTSFDHETLASDRPDIWFENQTYIFKPARASYAPVSLGYQALFSILTDKDDKLSIGVDPFFYIWNPYNHRIDVNNYGIQLTNYPGHITLWVNKDKGDEKRYGPATLANIISNNNTSVANRWNLTYLLSGVSLAPGEVVIVSPPATRPSDANQYHDILELGTNVNNVSGAIMNILPKVDNSSNTTTVDSFTWEELVLDDSDEVSFLYSQQYNFVTETVVVDGATTAFKTNTPMQEHFWINTSLPKPGISPANIWEESNLGNHLQQVGGNVQGNNNIVSEYFNPLKNMEEFTPSGSELGQNIRETKRFFGLANLLAKPANHQGPNPNKVEVFDQFNLLMAGGYTEQWRPCLLHQIFSSISSPADFESLTEEAGIAYPPASARNGYYGEDYIDGSTSVPLLNIPTRPLYSLAQFSNANLNLGGHTPMKTVGNSRSSLFVSPTSLYQDVAIRGTVASPTYLGATASDTVWLLNDALFDRYYLSGIAPDYAIGASGYGVNNNPESLVTQYADSGDSVNIEIQKKIKELYNGSTSTNINPALEPFIPLGETSDTIQASLTPTAVNADAYKKLGAYAFIDGAFNVNSTSILAWESIIRANKSLFGGATTPFPSQVPPVSGSGANTHWEGYPSLSDAQVTALATSIVAEVRSRGPFLSLSEFVNHKLGSIDARSYSGALQAAIDSAGLNSTIESSAGGGNLEYSDGNMPLYFAENEEFPPVGSRQSTTGIISEITQADLLTPIAPILTARSDTFKITAYGEVTSNGGAVQASATCVATVQRIPEYVNSSIALGGNDPWDDNDVITSNNTLSPINSQLGRRFKIVSIEWL